MRLSISARDRRALALGAFGIVTAIGAARAVPALRQWAETSQESARELLLETARADVTVRAASALQDSMSVRSERFVALAPALLDGTSAATAAATLASLISGAAATSDAKLGSVHVQADTTTHESSGTATRTFARVSVRASVTADVRGLSKLLLALERGPILLAVEELTVTQPEFAADASRPEMLQVELVVSGLAFIAAAESQ